jgi:lysophospholipase L1-like esterase
MRRTGGGTIRRAAIAVLAVVVVVGAVLAVVGWLQPRPLVLLAGDSITSYSEGVLAGAIDGTFGIGGHDVEVVARPGATAGEMAPEVVAVAARQPEQVIINLGTNDAARTATVAEGLAEIERMAAAFPGARCIHLVTLSESMVAFEDPVGPGSRAAELNQGIIDLAGRAGYHLIRWDQMVAEGTARGEPLTLDSIHPDEAGAARLATAYADAIASC